jgi:ubiquinone/menaquinone biosynthesis C-methylase UbiE
MTERQRVDYTGNKLSSVQSRITAFWNEVAADYEARPGNVATRGSGEYAAWVDAVRSLLPTNPSDVLDVGTGTGFVALIAAALGHRVTGIDLAENMLAMARRQAGGRGLSVSLIVGDAVKPPVAEESFDAVTSRSLIWTLRDLSGAFGNWRRALRPHGRLIAFYGVGSAAPPPGPAREFFERYYTKEIQAAMPAIELTDHRVVEQAAEQAGFTAIEVTELLAVRDAASEESGTPCVVTARRL